MVARSAAGGQPGRTVAEGNQAGPAVQRAVSLPVAPARLLWPPAPVAPVAELPLASERPLTVPHDTNEHVDVPPPVQRVSFDAPAAPAAPATPVTGTRARPVAPVHSEQEPPEVAAPPLPVMRTEAAEDHRPRQDLVRALPLQRMFGDLTTAGSSEPVQEMRWQAPVQRDQIATSPAAEAPPAPAPDVQAVAAAAPAAPAPAGAPPATDLDEMAKRLYEPLTARLRAELWLDRERAGLVTDRRY